MRAWAIAACLAAAALAAGCLIDRSPLAPWVGPMDAGVDAPPSPPDAHELDAFGPDAFTSGDAFVSRDAFVPRDTGACDERGESCCGAECRGGLACRSALCDLPGCGAVGAPCCLGEICFGTSACNGASCEACGGEGQLCCLGDSCEMGLDCDGTRCVACGDLGEPCCGGTCRAGACLDGACRPPDGTRGGRCIPPLLRCEAWSFCNVSGTCEACGRSGELCCLPPQSCEGSLDCEPGLGLTCR
ncbi:MAG: hypothetical protein ACK5U8_09350 [Deltaproteobacteria bacterium]